jgi:hypothetical protein
MILENIVTLVASTFESPLTKSTIEVSESGRTGAAKGVAAPKQTRTETISSKFKLVFLSVLAITVLTVAGQFAIATQWDNPPPNLQATFEALGFAWKAGTGAIFGLLGGKVA